DSGISFNNTINIAIAIAGEEGLIVPAILDCGDKSLKEVSLLVKDLAGRSDSGTLSTEEYTGGTFAISNLGMFDVTSFVAIIHPPQSAVLAVGTVQSKPAVVDGEIVIRDMMTATLSADHRIVDGSEGAQFIIEVKRLLETPVELVI
ncbi:MAG: 2-oxo acid dehydrogenase subunit E2, partial [SAR202 cluster bacterium]|nr:2-oxo acid dehydrogenase subunit E2 [SAR202 cluster bacterium]